MEALEVDTRLEFIGNYVQKTLKLKPEKWTKLLSAAEYRILIQEFLDKIDPIILVISQVSTLLISQPKILVILK